MEHLRIIVYVLALSGALLVLFNKKRLTPAFHWTGWFLLFAGLSQISGYLLFRYVGNNVAFYNGALLINYALLFMMLYHLSVEASYRKKLILIFGICGLGILYFAIPSFNELFASRALTILNIAISIGCLLFLYEMLLVPSLVAITKQGHFWIVASLLIHHVSGFTYWLFYELLSMVNNKLIFGRITPFLAIILYAMLIIAIFVQLNYSINDRTSSDK